MSQVVKKSVPKTAINSVQGTVNIPRVVMQERAVKVEQAPGLPFDRGRFELVVEPMPEGSDTPAILGVPVDDVRALRTDTASVWSSKAVEERLRRS